MTRATARSFALVLAALLPLPACYGTVDRQTEAHAADTRSKDEQTQKIEKKDEKDGPKDTTPVVGRDSVKVDGG